MSEKAIANNPLGLFSRSASLYRRLGSHPLPFSSGFRFNLWAPNALAVYISGDFNNWNERSHPLALSAHGIWSIDVEKVTSQQKYKYIIATEKEDFLWRNDPCAYYFILDSEITSATWESTFTWHDQNYFLRLSSANATRRQPISIYELHIGSWKTDPNKRITYKTIAPVLAEYVLDMGFTHIELLPLTEHPFDGSWGYQTTGYFAPTSRYGTPDDFKYFINHMHENGIGVIIDWVPAHFPRDDGALANFDGTPLFEIKDERHAAHDQWGTLRFDVSDDRIRSFLISSALHFFSEYHVDGIRVDAVASLLHLDYGRNYDLKNCYGGIEDLDGISFLKELTSKISRKFPHALIIAEDSSDYQGVTKSHQNKGLGFTYKWNMGWMNDTLRYMETDPLFRGGVHNLMTFSLMYAFTESFILPISHDECVHGKKSLLDKMPGKYKDKFASTRLYLTYMFTHPGKKLLFMGSEFGQFIEWRYYEQLEWELLKYDSHAKLHGFVKDLLHFYKKHSPLWAKDNSWNGFLWSNPDDNTFDVFSYIRVHKNKMLLIILNATPIERNDYLLGVPKYGKYKLIFNTDESDYFGSDSKIKPEITAVRQHFLKFRYTLCADLPPLSALIYEYER